MIAEKTCLACGEPLKGRIDKKFCDDSCRNAYNNAANRDINSYMRRVNHTLRKNRKILEQLVPLEKGTLKIRRKELIYKGFAFGYYTNSYQSNTGNQYKFVYEYSYFEINEEWLALVLRKQYLQS